MPDTTAVAPELAPIWESDSIEADEYGETTIQLREQGRYEYQVFPVHPSDLRVRCQLARRRAGLHDAADAGRIETGSYCGKLLLELVEGPVDWSKPPVGSAILDIRSIKLNYRTEYRGMVRAIADRLAALTADARSSAKSIFRSSFNERQDAGWLQLQLELLREVIDSRDFSASLQRVVLFPHERLTAEVRRLPSNRAVRWSPATVRTLIQGQPRRGVPENHRLRTIGLDSVAQTVTCSRKVPDVDTPENRFIKYSLEDYRHFLAHAKTVFESAAGWETAAATANRLSEAVSGWLSRGMFREVGNLSIVPHGSPVLQRKAGYRELYRWWLRFRTAAGISWEGGEDAFHAGQRDIATLYEYWLFFQLLDWFCRRCRANGARPRIEELVSGLDEGIPDLRLRRGEHLGPFMGSVALPSRRLACRFDYNRAFRPTRSRAGSGSWTRTMTPDYTLSFWPEDMTEQLAEQEEMMVHIHFDAKYRVEDYERLFGGEDEEGDGEETPGLGNYARADLLKMHAYKDAIERSHGAYIVYPGLGFATNDAQGRHPHRGRWPNVMFGFHEILPGIGAFAVAPDTEGRCVGFEHIELFMEEVIAHLANRATARERITYHLAEAYLGERPVPDYGPPELPETDGLTQITRAEPPAEQVVLPVDYGDVAQLWLAEEGHGLLWLALPATVPLYVHPVLSRSRYFLMRQDGALSASGLIELREPGFMLMDKPALRSELEDHFGNELIQLIENDDDNQMYAVYRTRASEAFRGRRWDLNTVAQESTHNVVEHLGHNYDLSALSLTDLLRALVADSHAPSQGITEGSP